MACGPVDTVAGWLGYHKPLSNEGLVVIVDGYGNQGAFGDAVNGRKVVVRDDLEPNANGWFTREINEVSDLKDLGIDARYKAVFQIEYERDFSVRNNDFVGYFSMNVDPQVAKEDIQKFLDVNPDVKPTSVVVRLDGEGKRQECSMDGLAADAVRFVLYAGENISYQLCDLSWTVPQ